MKFETHSVSGIFQRKSEGRLDKINFAKTKSGYILIPGRDDKEHVQNLASVLTFIKSNGFRLKFLKLSFYNPKYNTVNLE